MKIRLLWGFIVISAAVTLTSMLMTANQPPRLEVRFQEVVQDEGNVTSADLPAVTPLSVELASPTPFPTIAPLPTQAPVDPSSLTPTSLPFLIDLNFHPEFYYSLGITPEQGQEIFALRCDPATPPLQPYPELLEGCGPDAGGIVVLDQIVEAGIMTEQEVIDHLVGKVVQTWR